MVVYIIKKLCLFLNLFLLPLKYYLCKMKGKIGIGIYWLVVLCCLTYYFFYFVSYTFDVQEEMQMFFPDKKSISSFLLSSGGLCKLLGMSSIQFFDIPFLSAVINGSLLTFIGFICYLLLKQIEIRTYNLFLALVIPLFLLKIHADLDYLIDGSYGIALILICMWIVSMIQGKRVRFAVTLIGTAVVYWAGGQLVVLYVLMELFYESVRLRKIEKYHIVVLLLGIVLAYFGVRFSLRSSLFLGFKQKDFYSNMLQPEPYIFYVWIRVFITFFTVLVIAFILSFLCLKSRYSKIGLNTVLIILTACFGSLSNPSAHDYQNWMMDSLSYLSRRGRWDTIIKMHEGKIGLSPINLNYVNMALAHQGELGNRLFNFEQKGQNGLTVPYNMTYYVSTLLSDVYFTIGDMSTSESYAMESLSLARRNGSPRALIRLAEISHLRGAKDVEEKYLKLLRKMPHYRSINIEECIEGKNFPNSELDQLLCFMPIDSLLTIHIETEHDRNAYEYLGCYYLLGLDTDRMKEFLLKYSSNPNWVPMPIHFQEAALQLFIGDSKQLSHFPIDEKQSSRFRDFVQAVKSVQANRNLNTLKQSFGNTFWFYYQMMSAKKKNRL